MIRIIYLKDEHDGFGMKGVFAPVFICDTCHEPIQRAGNYCYDASDIERTVILTTCKGRCTDAAERSIKAHPEREAFFHWNELTQLLECLRVNLKNPVADVLNP